MARGARGKSTVRSDREASHATTVQADAESNQGGNEEEEEDDDAEGNEVYCVCRRKDDGRPMVWCAGGCDDW